MKQMKKWMALALAVAMVVSMALTGCGGNDEGGETIKIGVNY